MPKKIGLVFKPGLTSEQLYEAVSTLDKLMTAGGDYQLRMEQDQWKGLTNLLHIKKGELADCDFVIAFGGDGTMLGVLRDLANAAKDYVKLIQKRLPIVLGVNMGTVGFITDIPLAEAGDLLYKIIHEEHHYYESRNTLLIEGDFGTECAANDVLLQREGGRLLDFDVELNGQFAYSCRADGLLVSTPTGSTAYSLAAGGPIIDPCVDAVLITPMMPQNLSSRPLVVTADTMITVRLTGTQGAKLYIDGNETHCAGCTEYTITDGPYVNFGYHTADHRGERDFTKALRNKLGWNS